MVSIVMRNCSATTMAPAAGVLGKITANSSPVSCGQITGPLQGVHDGFTGPYQGVITSQVTIIIIKGFEVINITQY